MITTFAAFRSVKPHVRRRSARRRSSEKSAKQIAREAEPFWRLKTRHVDVRGDNVYVARILGVDDGYLVIVNGKPVNLPVDIKDADHVALHRIDSTSPLATLVATTVNRYTVLPSWICWGATVNYTPPDGGAPKLNCRVLVEPFRLATPLGGSRWVAILDKHRGWVPCESLTRT